MGAVSRFPPLPSIRTAWPSRRRPDKHSPPATAPVDRAKTRLEVRASPVPSVPLVVDDGAAQPSPAQPSTLARTQSVAPPSSEKDSSHTGGVSVTDEHVRAVQRRTLVVVTASQVLGGAGLAAGVTVGGLLAQDMLGSEGVAGLPSGVFTLGSAIAAFAVGRYSQVAGRRPGLAAGFMAGSVGAAGIVIAAVVDSPVLFFASLLVYGSGTATNLQARYAGTDLATRTSRGTAVSIALVATTLGAVAGPNLVGPLGDLADTLGIPRLAGPFLLAAVAYGAAGACMFPFLRPDPLHVARTLDDYWSSGQDDPDGASAHAD